MGKKSNLIRVLSKMGPGFIIAATTIGAGSIVSFTNAGADFGFNLVWWLIVLALSQYFFNYAMKEYTVVTGNTVIDGIAKNYGRAWAVISAIAAFAGQVIYGIGNFIAVSLGFTMLFPNMPFKVGGFIGLAACIIMFIAKNIYKKVEVVTKICSIIMVVLFIVSLIATGASRGTAEVVSKSIVGIPEGSFLLMLSVMGTTCNLSTQAWSCNLAKQKGYSKEDIDNGGLRLDTIVQIIVVIGVSACCLFIGAMLLPGNPIANGGELVSALAELLGGWIRPVFGIAFLAAAWSSQMAAPQIGVDLLFDAIGKGRDHVHLESAINIIMLVFAAIIAYIVGGIPAQLLTVAQVGGIICTPLLGVFTILLVNRKEDMKEYKSKGYFTAILVVLFLIQLAVIVNNIMHLI